MPTTLPLVDGSDTAPSAIEVDVTRVTARVPVLVVVSLRGAVRSSMGTFTIDPDDPPGIYVVDVPEDIRWPEGQPVRVKLAAEPVAGGSAGAGFTARVRTLTCQP